MRGVLLVAALCSAIPSAEVKERAPITIQITDAKGDDGFVDPKAEASVRFDSTCREVTLRSQPDGQQRQIDHKRAGSGCRS
jgi:hypothetical protein